MNKGNFFSHIPEHMLHEFFEDILKTDKFRIERIISEGHASPKDFWYDQETNEWVMLIKGSAALVFEGKDEAIIMKPGDYINIPAHTRHRVEQTDSDQKTIWLAIHW